MNINNFLEKVLVENGLPIKEGWYHTANGYFFYAPSKKMWIVDANYIRPETIKYWYRPVTRESIEAFLREFGEKVVKKTMESHYRYVGGFTENPKVDMQAALTELINKTLGQ